MTDGEQIVNVIDCYMNLLRLQKAQGEDREKEIMNQLRAAKAKLEAFGIVPDDLKIE